MNDYLTTKMNAEDGSNIYSCILKEAMELITQMRKDKEFILAKKTLEELMDFDIVKEDEKLMKYLKTFRGILIKDIRNVLDNLRLEKKKWNNKSQN